MKSGRRLKIDYFFSSKSNVFKMQIKALVDQRESLFGHGDDHTMGPGEGASLHTVFIKCL